jgi:hypothetical protein
VSEALIGFAISNDGRGQCDGLATRMGVQRWQSENEFELGHERRQRREIHLDLLADPYWVGSAQPGGIGGRIFADVSISVMG